MTTKAKVGKRKGRAGRGALIMVALMFAASGALRLGDGMGQAIAKTESSEMSGQPANCPLPPLELTQALQAREADLTVREAVYEERRAALALADQAIEVRLARLAEAEDSLKQTLALADGAAEADLTRLTEVYQTMKPKDAARLFSAMAPEFAAGFMGRMRPDSAAAILSGMTAEAAYEISALLAGRNALAPKE